MRYFQLQLKKKTNLNKNLLFLCSSIKFVLGFDPGQISTAPSKAELPPFIASQNPAQNAPISDYCGEISQRG